jgi:hypothetical protein
MDRVPDPRTGIDILAPARRSTAGRAAPGRREDHSE